MKQKEMIEMIQQDYPDIGETQIRAMLNRAMDKFSEETKGLLQKTAKMAPVADKRRYSFSDFTGITDSEEVLKVTRVDFNNKPVKRFIGNIDLTDTDPS